MGYLVLGAGWWWSVGAKLVYYVVWGDFGAMVHEDKKRGGLFIMSEMIIHVVLSNFVSWFT